LTWCKDHMTYIHSMCEFNTTEPIRDIESDSVIALIII